MNTPPTFRRWLKQLRAERDLTQEQLAEQVACSVDAIRAFESGRRRPSRAMAERLGEVLDVASDRRTAFVRSARADEAEKSDPPPPQHAPAPTHPVAQLPRISRLPVPPTALIGRAAEETEIRRRLLDPACRLVTLTGAGGTGKTRLALQVAASLAADPIAQPLFVDGVSFIGLAQVTTADTVAATIADVLGCPPTTGTAEDALLHWLRDRNLLLVLDNLEHLLDAAPLFTAMLREAPGVRLLATSRERLLIGGEWVMEVGGLATPPDDSRDAIDRADAVLLFLERARQMNSQFALTPHNRTAVARICRLLDGMPLGIELAAAWVQALSPDEIAAELEHTLDLPERAWRDLPQRHRSLRAVFDHSWRLLAPDEQRVLCCLSIFRGGFTRDAAKEIAAATLPTLASLADKSLLRRSRDGRYEMHPLVQHFAAEELAQRAAVSAEVRARYASYYARWLADREQAVQTGMGDDAAVVEVRAELDNLWLALDWIIEHRNAALLLQALGTIVFFLEFRCFFREGIALFERAARAFAPQATSSAATPADLLAYGQMLAYEGWFRSRSGDRGGALAVLRDSLTILRKQDQQAPLFRPTFGIGASLLATGSYAEAQRWLCESLEIARAVGDRHDTAYALTLLGNLAHVQGQLQHAHDLLREALEIWRVIGIGVVPCLNRLGAVLLDLNQYDHAEPLLQESLHISSNRDDPEGFAAALMLLGKGAASQGRIDESIYMLAESIATFREIGAHERLGRALVLLGWSHLMRSSAHEARIAFTEALQIGTTRELAPVVCNALWGIASLDAQDRVWDRALLLLIQILDHPSTEHGTRLQAAHLRAEIEAQLDPAHLVALHQEAQTRPFETVVADVLRGSHAVSRSTLAAQP